MGVVNWQEGGLSFSQSLSVSIQEEARQCFMKHVDLTMQRAGGECVRVAVTGWNQTLQKFCLLVVAAVLQSLPKSAVTSSSSRVRLLNEK
jgi:hypothetical protein